MTNPVARGSHEPGRNQLSASKAGWNVQIKGEWKEIKSERQAGSRFCRAQQVKCGFGGNWFQLGSDMV